MKSETEKPKDVFVKIGGKTYRCECGANVFHWAREDRLECNGCGAWYQAVRETENE